MFNHVINERSQNEDFAALAVKNVKQEALLVAQVKTKYWLKDILKIKAC
jgi:hypothetical protein